MGYTTIRYAFVSYTLICSVRSGIEAMPSSSWCQTGGSQKTAEGKYLSYLLTCLVEEDWYVLPLRGRSYFVRIESIQIHRSISVRTTDRCILNSSWSTTQMALQYIYDCCLVSNQRFPFTNLWLHPGMSRGRGWLVVGAIYCHQFFWW